MKHLIATALLLAGGLPALASPPPKGDKQDRKSRPFYMGVDLMPHDMSVEGMAALFAFLNTNVDLIPLKLDKGVPWPEALEKRSYSPEYEKGLAEVQEQFKDRKLFLSVTPLNGDKADLAGYRGAGENEPLEGGWKGKDFDDPAIAKAYLSYCSDLIRRFRPEFFAYALEVNALAKNPQRWKKFVLFATDIYTALKKENPKLPIFVTLNGDTYLEDPQAQKKAIAQILPASDYVAIQTIPYIKEQVPGKLGREFLAQFAALAPGKPFAVANTAFLAEDFAVAGLERVGKAAWQQEYLKFVLEECARLNAKFVIWALARDMDDLVQRLGPLGEFAKIFKDTGLIDGKGNPRKSCETWQSWLKLPKK
jgi:hypothetical protein